jgi:hypothetical protein
MKETATIGCRPVCAPSPSRVSERIDRAVARLLRVQPQPPQEAVAATGSRPFETPLLLAGARCILRYVVLPFLLPLAAVATGGTLGVVTGTALALLLIVDVIAVGAIVATLRRLWRVQHPRRWRYLPLALAFTLLVAVFFVNDARLLLV